MKKAIADKIVRRALCRIGLSMTGLCVMSMAFALEGGTITSIEAISTGAPGNDMVLVFGNFAPGPTGFLSQNRWCAVTRICTTLGIALLSQSRWMIETHTRVRSGI
jgi:hypothetical protein